MDVIGFVETCYWGSSSEATWLSRLSELACPSIDQGYGVSAIVYESSNEGTPRVRCLGTHNSALSEGFIKRACAATPPWLWQMMVGLGGGVQTGVGICERTSALAEPKAFYDSLEPELPVADHLGAMTYLERCCCVLVGAHAAVNVTPTRRQTLLWKRLLWHLAAGWRLRHWRGAEEAIFKPDGKLVYATHGARNEPSRERLRSCVRNIEVARSRRVRVDAVERLDLWPGLVEGRWSLVDRFDSDGRRFVVAHANPPHFPDPRRLTERERACVHLASQGRSNANIAYGLGLSESTVGTHVASGMRKLGVSRRQQVLALQQCAVNARLVDDSLAYGATQEADTDLSRLTSAEQNVTHLVVQGLPNSEIAKQRRTSPRTVANQLSAIYRKLSITCRAELVAVALQPARTLARYGGGVSDASLVPAVDS